MIRTYDELITLDTFDERYAYLRLVGVVGESTFGGHRHLNQALYHSKEWADVRNFVILRDNACDLGISDREISGRIIIHHMNPLSLDDMFSYSKLLLDPAFLICTSHDTHNAIHYGDASLLRETEFVERKPNDQVPWR